jgi:1,4-dihydroxy-2-naphthoate octaprenyltransferase
MSKINSLLKYFATIIIVIGFFCIAGMIYQINNHTTHGVVVSKEIRIMLNKRSKHNQPQIKYFLEIRNLASNNTIYKCVNRETYFSYSIRDTI